MTNQKTKNVKALAICLAVMLVLSCSVLFSACGDTTPADVDQTKVYAGYKSVEADGEAMDVYIYIKFDGDNVLSFTRTSSNDECLDPSSDVWNDPLDTFKADKKVEDGSYVYTYSDEVADGKNSTGDDACYHTIKVVDSNKILYTITGGEGITMYATAGAVYNN